MIKYNKKVLILDELEQDLNSAIAYQIIENLLEKFSEKTIIVISHLETISERFQWSTKLQVRNEVVGYYD